MIAEQESGVRIQSSEFRRRSRSSRILSRGVRLLLLGDGGAGGARIDGAEGSVGWNICRDTQTLDNSTLRKYFAACKKR